MNGLRKRKELKVFNFLCLYSFKVLLHTSAQMSLGLMPRANRPQILACSRRSDSGARAKNKASERAGKKRGETYTRIVCLTVMLKIMLVLCGQS